MSSSREAKGGARHWFAGLGTAGAKVARRPERAEGPVLGTLYTLNGPVLKLTAQLLPVGDGDPREVRLQLPRPGGGWEDRAVAPVGPGFAAAFRVTGWDGAAERRYRVLWAGGTAEEQAFEGTVAADPAGDGELRVGLVDCTIHSYRPLNVGSDANDRLPGSDPLGLYTGRNLYFPYAELVAELGRRRPPAGRRRRPVLRAPAHHPRAGPEPTLDVLYRWYLWLWAFRDLTREVPTVVLVDDHDVYHPNLWGNAGAPAPSGDYRQGGYLHPAAWVNLVQRVQTSHNPDPHDPAPVAQGIGVYYGAFRYGGVGFAMVEDRKFKNGDKDNRDPAGRRYDLTILGDRQERFLAGWAAADPGSPKICFSQTLWGACRPTSGAGPSSTPTPTPPWPPAAPPWSWSSGPGRCSARATSTWAAWSATASTASTTARPVRRPGRRQRLAALVRAGRRPAQPRRHAPHRRLHRRLRQPHAGPGRGQPAAHQGRLPGRQAGPQRRAGRPAAQARGLRPGPGRQGGPPVRDRVLALGRRRAVRRLALRLPFPEVGVRSPPEGALRRRRWPRGCGPPPRG